MRKFFLVGFYQMMFVNCGVSFVALAVISYLHASFSEIKNYSEAGKRVKSNFGLIQKPESSMNSP